MKHYWMGFLEKLTKFLSTWLCRIEVCPDNPLVRRAVKEVWRLQHQEVQPVILHCLARFYGSIGVFLLRGFPELDLDGLLGEQL